jgi:hypothetical protein
MKDLEEKNEYRHKQAAACHSAATSTSSPEVRRAFLDLEQGWLQLIGNAPEEPTSGETTQQKPLRAPRPRSQRRT